MGRKPLYYGLKLSFIRRIKVASTRNWGEERWSGKPVGYLIGMVSLRDPNSRVVGDLQ